MKNSLIETLKKVIFGSKFKLRSSAGAGSKGLFYFDMINQSERETKTLKKKNQ